MSYIDLDFIQETDPGDVLTAAWCDTVNTNFSFFNFPPCVSAISSVTQSVSNSTNTVLSVTSEQYDNDGMHSNVTNSSRLTVQTAGRYQFYATVEYDAGGGRRLTDFLVNGSTALLGDSRAAAQGAGSTGTDDRVTIVRTREMIEGEYIEVRVNQNSGGNLGVQLLEFAARRLSR